MLTCANKTTANGSVLATARARFDSQMPSVCYLGRVKRDSVLLRTHIHTPTHACTHAYKHQQPGWRKQVKACGDFFEKESGNIHEKQRTK